MSIPILATKLFIPQPRPTDILRPHLIERLNRALHSKLILISAPAGFGKTTLLSEWVQAVSGATPPPAIAWLSLDEGDNDPTRFLAYLIAALRTLSPNIGEGVLGAIQSPQLPPIEPLLSALLNDIITIPANFALVLDDYHVIESKPIDSAIAFLLEHLPPQMHLVIAGRADPALPLARLRGRGQLTELRIADLRFTYDEVAEFLNQVMNLNLSPEDLAALGKRTEGWIAGLQLAALSMQGLQDTSGFIQSFTGSHHYVLDYLLEEVLHKQSENIQNFLLQTSILDRMCGSLCDAVLLNASASGQGTLERLERANLFIIPLDNERRWYRYHHLFADLLRQRLHQNITASNEGTESSLGELHIRASQWYEENGMYIDSFLHATSAKDIDRAERLIEGEGIPRHFRGAVTAILNWLESLPKTMLDSKPALWWRFGSLLLVTGHTTGVEEKLQAAETALEGILQGKEPDGETRNLMGQIASARSVLALTQYNPEAMLVQSRRALEYLHPNDRFSRSTAFWAQGYAYLFQRDRAAARQALIEAISFSQASGNQFALHLATIGLGNVLEQENELFSAVETYQRVIQLSGDQPLPHVYDPYLGLARIFYEWNNLDDAELYGRRSLQLARQYESVIDRYIVCEVFLARLKLAQGDIAGADAILNKANQSALQQNFTLRLPEIADEQVLILLRQGKHAAAAYLAQLHNLPIAQARVYLAQGNPSAALAILEPLRQQMETKKLKDQCLKVMVLQAVILHAQEKDDEAVKLLGDALALAEPGGFIRIFLDEGETMAHLLSNVSARGTMPDYVGRLLAEFKSEQKKSMETSSLSANLTVSETLSQRELEVLRFIALGLSNEEISKRLFLALDTVKGHNRRIFLKLQVQRRTEAVARARELGLL